MPEAAATEPATTPEPNRPNTTEREAIAGLVERVTFHNPENGFCVLRVTVRGQRDLVTVVGHAATISAGEFVQASIRSVGAQPTAPRVPALPPATPRRKRSAHRRQGGRA